MNENFSLKNRKSIILGGNGLLGSEIASLYSDLGSQVLVLDVVKESDFDKNQISSKKNISYAQYDAIEIKRFDKILSSYGTPQIFVNAAYPRTESWGDNDFKNITYESFSKNIELQLTNLCWLTKKVADQMVHKKVKGKIILLNSIYGKVAQDNTIYKGSNIKESMTYAVVKGGITNFTRQMASFYGEKNININSIVAGGVLGPVAGQSEKQDAIFLNNYSNRVPLKRLASPFDIARSAAFLASASAFDLEE